jgi:hypothetical protein
MVSMNQALHLHKALLPYISKPFLWNFVKVESNKLNINKWEEPK